MTAINVVLLFGWSAATVFDILRMESDPDDQALPSPLAQA